MLFPNNSPNSDSVQSDKVGGADRGFTLFHEQPSIKNLSMAIINCSYYSIRDRPHSLVIIIEKDYRNAFSAARLAYVSTTLVDTINPDIISIRLLKS